MTETTSDKRERNAETNPHVLGHKPGPSKSNVTTTSNNQPHPMPIGCSGAVKRKIDDPSTIRSKTDRSFVRTPFEVDLLQQTRNNVTQSLHGFGHNDGPAKPDVTMKSNIKSRYPMPIGWSGAVKEEIDNPSTILSKTGRFAVPTPFAIDLSRKTQHTASQSSHGFDHKAGPSEPNVKMTSNKTNSHSSSMPVGSSGTDPSSISIRSDTDHSSAPMEIDLMQQTRNMSSQGPDHDIKTEQDVEFYKKTIRSLSKQLGTTIVSSSTDNSSTEDVSSTNSNQVEQGDFEFAKKYTYTTNVSINCIIVMLVSVVNSI